MREPEISENEQARLEELYGFDIPDTPLEKNFDEMVQPASIICETPISLISLIDADRQWFLVLGDPGIRFYAGILLVSSSGRCRSHPGQEPVIQRS